MNELEYDSLNASSVNMFKFNIINRSLTTIGRPHRLKTVGLFSVSQWLFCTLDI